MLKHCSLLTRPWLVCCTQCCCCTVGVAAGAAQEAGKPASSSSQNTNSRQSSNANGSTGSSSRSSGSSNPSTVRRPPAAAAAAAVGAPSREASLALQSAFIQPAPLLPPSTPVSEAVLAWAEGLEDQPLVDWTSVLKDWKAGMATVKHPFTQQQVGPSCSAYVQVFVVFAVALLACSCCKESCDCRRRC
jgi:hypothetical protein